MFDVRPHYRMFAIRRHIKNIEFRRHAFDLFALRSRTPRAFKADKNVFGHVFA